MVLNRFCLRHQDHAIGYPVITGPGKIAWHYTSFEAVPTLWGTNHSSWIASLASVPVVQDGSVGRVTRIGSGVIDAYGSV